MLLRPLFFFIIVVSSAQAQWRDRYFTRIEERKAHTIIGRALESEFKPGPIKVLVWNIKKAELENWLPEFRMYSTEADLVLLQEAYTRSSFSATISHMSLMQWSFGMTFKDNKTGAYTGTMIGTRVSPVESFVRQSPDLETLIQTPKSATFSKFKLAGQKGELLVVSMHAINFTGLRPFKNHVGITLTEVAKHRGPVLYAGDFNTWSKSRLDHLNKQTSILGLTPVTFNDGDSRITFRGQYLDHAYVRGLKVSSADIIEDSTGSDHRPMTLTIEP